MPTWSNNNNNNSDDDDNNNNNNNNNNNYNYNYNYNNNSNNNSGVFRTYKIGTLVRNWSKSWRAVTGKFLKTIRFQKGDSTNLDILRIFNLGN